MKRLDKMSGKRNDIKQIGEHYRNFKRPLIIIRHRLDKKIFNKKRRMILKDNPDLI